MKNNLSVKKLIAIFLSLHTSVVAMFVYVTVKSGIFPGSLFWAASFFVFLALITAYTVFKVSVLVTREIADATKAVFILSMRLKKLSSEVKDNAKELEYRASLISGYANTVSGLAEKLYFMNSGVPYEQDPGKICVRPENDIRGTESE